MKYQKYSTMTKEDFRRKKRPNYNNKEIFTLKIKKKWKKFILERYYAMKTQKKELKQQ
jgi:hypothetical protein